MAPPNHIAKCGIHNGSREGGARRLPYSFSAFAGQVMRCSSHRFLIIGHSALCAFSFLLCQTTAWAQDADTEAAQHFAAAHQAQDAGNLDLAAREYLAVIRLRPDVRTETYASLGLVYNARGNLWSRHGPCPKPKS